MKRIIALVVASLCITTVLLSGNIAGTIKQNESFKKWEGLSLEEAKEQGLTVRIVPELSDEENIFLNKMLRYYDENGIITEFESMLADYQEYYYEEGYTYKSNLSFLQSDNKFTEMLRYLKKNDSDGYLVTLMYMEKETRGVWCFRLFDDYMKNYSPDAGKNNKFFEYIQTEYQSGYGLSISRYELGVEVLKELISRNNK